MDPTDMEETKPPRKPLPPQRRPKSKVLRFLGINPYILKDFIPRGKTAAYMTLAASPIAFYLYDRRCAEEIMEQYKSKVRHLAEAPMPDSGDLEKDELEFPRKVWVMSTRVPDDSENDRGNRWFKNYIQPVLYAAGYDYSFLNGTAPGALGRRVSERIRLDRTANMTPQPRVQPGEAGYGEYLDKRRFAEAQGLTVIVGRNTLKEYLWGMKEGWLTDFDAVQEERGEEGRMQDLREQLAKDGAFDEAPLHPELDSLGDDSASPSTSSSTTELSKSRPSLMPQMASFNFYNPSTPLAASTPSESSETRSLIVPAVSDIPAQPPMFFLPFDHPLGYLRYWPIKMFKFLFFERYRVQKGCETALSIIQAVHPTHEHTSAFLDEGDSRRGLRPIEKPKNLDQTRKEDDQVELEDVLNEKKKKLKEEWQGWPLPETGSKDLDTGLEDEYHYRKSYNDTPANIVAARKEFYDTLPEKLRVARELANRDRLPTKEEQKYPPPTEQELVEDRLNRERRWRNDFHGWLMTRKGSKVTWDPRFETFKVLDLELAKANREKYGHVAEHSS